MSRVTQGVSNNTDSVLWKIKNTILVIQGTEFLFFTDEEVKKRCKIAETRTICTAYIFREVVHVNIEKIIEVLISLLAEQEGVTIEYTIEKPE